MSVATVLGISSRATGQLNNGVGKLSSPSARPKSVAYNGTTRITKHSPDNSSCGFRDSKASSLRKAVSSDLHRKVLLLI